MTRDPSPAPSPRPTDAFPFAWARPLDGEAGALRSAERLAFVHIPKTAGTSLSVWLRAFFSSEEALPTALIPTGPGEWGPDAGTRYRFLQAHLPFAPFRAAVPDAHFVTFLRDPVDRVISNYWQYRRGPEPRTERQHLARRLSLDEWIAEQDATGASYLTDVHVWALAGPEDSFATGRPPAGVTPDDMASLVDRAFENLRREFAFFGLVERYVESLELFAFVFGVPGHRAEPGERKNVRRDEGREPVVAELRARIAAQNRFDVALYEQAAALFEERRMRVQRTLLSLAADGLAAAVAPPEASAPEGELDLVAGELLEGQGLYDVEESPNGRFRWTGAEEVTTLDVIAGFPAGGEVVVEIEATAAVRDGAWARLDVRVDDRPARRDAGAAGDGRLLARFRVAVPDDEPRTPRHHLVVLDGPRRRPVGPDGTRDRRPLGIGLRRVTIRWTPVRTVDATEPPVPAPPVAQPPPSPGHLQLRTAVAGARRIARTVRDARSAVTPVDHDDTEAIAQIGALRQEVDEIREQLVYVWEVRDLLDRILADAQARESESGDPDHA